LQVADPQHGVQHSHDILSQGGAWAGMDPSG
jgi:hypothetical protein